MVAYTRLKTAQNATESALYSTHTSTSIEWIFSVESACF